MIKHLAGVEEGKRTYIKACIYKKTRTKVWKSKDYFMGMYDSLDSLNYSVRFSHLCYQWEYENALNRFLLNA